ncbi:MAG: serine protease [Hyphomicrobiaceae bacterium]
MIAENILADIEAAARIREFDSCKTSIETLRDLWRDPDQPRLPAQAALAAARALRGQRQFGSVIALSDLWKNQALAGAKPEQGLFLYRSQALIEEGRLDEAIGEMLPRLADFEPGSDEHAEAWGRLGRAYKQHYIDAKPPGDCGTLLQAIGAYAEVAKRNGSEEKNLTRYHWHEINLIALTARAELDGCDPGHELDSATWARDLAERLRHDIETNTPDDVMWKLASLGECHIAMGQFAKAREVYARYLQHPSMELFECASSLRQLKEVWRLAIRNDAPEAAEESALLRSIQTRMEELAAARLEGGGAQGGAIGLTAADSARLERFDRDAPSTSSAQMPSKPIGHTRIHTMARRLRAVTLIRDRLDNWIYGTGFFVRGDRLAEWLGNDIYLLTNAHVLGRTDRRALAIEDAVLDVWDDASGAMLPYDLDNAVIAWESRELDATLVRLAACPAAIDGMPIAPSTAMARTLEELPAARRRCIFVGAMLGQQVGTDFVPCAIEDVGWRSPEPGAPIYIYHRARTQPGSSGSPILDLDYNVVGLHRAGGSQGKTRSGLPPLNGLTHHVFAEEAVSLLSIRQAVAAAAPTSSASHAARLSLDDEPDAPGEDEALALYFEYDEEHSKPFAPVLRERPHVHTERAFRDTCEWFLVDAASSIFSSKRFAAARR